MDQIFVDHLYVYATGPTDYWEGLLPADDWLRAPGTPSDVRDRLARWGEALAAVRQHPWWDGKLQGGSWPMVSGLPSGEPSPHVFFTWKIENNGTTFVVSPVRLPWLEGQFEVFRKVRREDTLLEDGARLLDEIW